MSHQVVFKVFLDKMGGTSVEDYIGRFGDLFYDPYAGVLRISDGVTHGGNAIGSGPQAPIDGGTF